MEARLGHAPVHAGKVDGVDAGKVGAGAGKLGAGLVEEAGAEGPHGAHAAVVGGRAADGERDVAHAARDGVGDQLAGAVGAGKARVPLRRGKQGQAGGGGHLDDRETPGKKPVARLDGAAQRVGHGKRHALAAERGHEGVDRPLPAVGDLERVEGRVREEGRGLLGQKLSGAGRGDGALE